MQLIKLNSGIKNGTEVTLNISSLLILLMRLVFHINYHYFIQIYVPQVQRLCKNFANNSSANINLSKTQLSKLVQLGEFYIFISVKNGKSRRISKKIDEKKNIMFLAVNLAGKVRKNRISRHVSGYIRC